MRVVVLALLSSISCLAGQPLKNWTGPYPTCIASPELLKYETMDLGVRFFTSNAALAVQFKNTISFWATVVHINWHTDQTSSCAIELLDGNPRLFEDSTIAKSQLPDRSGFQGLIAFNPQAPLTEEELFLTAVHELGHMLGVPHNPDPSSVMYYTNRQGSNVLDVNDLLALSKRHKLRSNVQFTSIRCINANIADARGVGLRRLALVP